MKNVEDIYPLAPIQEMMLFHLVSAPRSAVLCEQHVFELGGALDPEVLRRAWDMTLRRQPVLRTSFLSKGLGKPVQVVRKEVELPWRFEDVAALDEGTRGERLAALWQEDLERGFVPDRAPLLRLTLARAGDERHFLGFTYHHILLDVWSAALVLRDALLTYQALAAGREPELPPVRPYRDYINWLKGRDEEAAEAYWRETLRGFAEPTPLGSDRRPGDAAGEEWREAERVLDSERTAALEALARSSRVTLNTLLEGAWGLFLALRSGRDDVVFGTTATVRPLDLSGSDRIVGMFVNNLPVRVRPDRSAALGDWLRAVQSAGAERRRYEHASLGTIQGAAEVASGRQLFRSLLVFQDAPSLDLQELERGPRVLSADMGELRTNYPLTLVGQRSKEMELLLIYDGRRFETATAEGMLDGVGQILQAFVATPQATLEELLERLAPSVATVASGGVDGSDEARPERRRARAESDGDAPRSEIERAIAEVWQEVLDVDEISIHDSFWDLGGNSMHAMQALTRLEKMGLRINPHDIALQNLGQLAAILEERGAEIRTKAPGLAGRLAARLRGRG